MMVLIRYDWCPYNKKKDTRGGCAQRDDMRKDNKTAAIRELRREALGETNPVASCSQTSSLQNGKKVHFCCLSLPVSDVLSRGPS